MSTTETRIRIERDDDFEPWGDGDLTEETEKLASGEWGAYGVIAESQCACCGKWGAKHASLWGVVVVGGEEGTYATLDEIQDPYLREVAAEELAELGATT